MTETRFYEPAGLSTPTYIILHHVLTLVFTKTAGRQLD